MARHRLAARNCDTARAAGLAPARRGEPGYYPHLDADGDGIACEPWPSARHRQIDRHVVTGATGAKPQAPDVPYPQIDRHVVRVPD